MYKNCPVVVLLGKSGKKGLSTRTRLIGVLIAHCDSSILRSSCKIKLIMIFCYLFLFSSSTSEVQQGKEYYAEGVKAASTTSMISSSLLFPHT